MEKEQLILNTHSFLKTEYGNDCLMNNDWANDFYKKIRQDLQENIFQFVKKLDKGNYLNIKPYMIKEIPEKISFFNTITEDIIKKIEKVAIKKRNF